MSIGVRSGDKQRESVPLQAVINYPTIKNQVFDSITILHTLYLGVTFINCTFKNVLVHNTIFKDCTFINCKFTGNIQAFTQADKRYIFKVFQDCTHNNTSYEIKQDKVIKYRSNTNVIEIKQLINCNKLDGLPLLDILLYESRMNLPESLTSLLYI